MFLRIENPLAPGERSHDVTQVRAYLAAFGYIPSKRLIPFVGKLSTEFDVKLSKAANPKNPEIFDGALEEAVRLFQRTYSLPEDGGVNGPTLELMRTPRCGVPDFPDRIGARYATICSWPRRNLRYHINDTLPQIGEPVHRATFIDNLQKWAAHAPLTFAEGPLGSEVQSFNYEDDGCGGTYAYAYPPCSGSVSGDTHYDVFDCWSAATPTPGNRADFVSVCLHEIGHALGLAHSGVRSAVMYAYFDFGEMRRNPTSDDISGIQALYPRGRRGKATKASSTKGRAIASSKGKKTKSSKRRR